jgi:Fe-S cluster biosynthesis and repair protein YggX
MSEPFGCGRCDREDPGRIERKPFPNELGERIVTEICADCWEEWKQRQMLLINHYGLKLHKPSAREFLYANLRAFLFGEGEAQAEIDLGEEGSVTW